MFISLSTLLGNLNFTDSGLIFAGGTAGLSNDSYMTRFEYISDIITSMCENAGIGFDVRGNIADRGFKFYLLKGVDRSFNQTENPRVIFSSHWKNVISQSFEHGVDNLLNAVYASTDRKHFHFRQKRKNRYFRH